MKRNRKSSGKPRKRRIHGFIEKQKSKHKQKKSNYVPSIISSHNPKLKYLTTGYIRQIDEEITKNIKFSDIANIIYQYYEPSWQFDTYHNKFGQVIENGTRCIGNGNAYDGKSHICCFTSSTGLNKGITQWSIKCNKEYGPALIGVVSSSHYKQASHKDTWLVLSSLNEECCARHGSINDQLLSQGDIITLQLDCTQKIWTAYFWINKQFQKKIQLKDENVNVKYHPSIEFWSHTPGDQDYKLLQIYCHPF